MAVVNTRPWEIEEAMLWEQRNEKKATTLSFEKNEEQRTCVDHNN